MRRKLTLYIDGKAADISDDSFVLFNWAFTDLEKPTAVKNSYSKQITLPGTPANDEIFGLFSRPDHIIPTGGFNPLLRTPFTIRADSGEVLQSGYLKLDKVVRGRYVKTYTVTLYGGLGSFLYGLMYDSDGNQRRLYDLTYYGTLSMGEETALDLTRTVNRSLIYTSWMNIDYANPTTAAAASFRALNWVPCYNGLPDNFDADKALVYLGAGDNGGFPATLTDEDNQVTYYPHNGWGLVKFSRKFGEWAVRDLRSYLQRPALNIKCLLDSLSKPANNGGYTVEWKTRPPKEENLWLTLKRPCELEIVGEDTTDTYTDKTGLAISLPDTFTKVERIALSQQGSATLALSLSPMLLNSAAPSSSNRLYESFDRYKKGSTTEETASAATFMQVVALDTSGNVKAASAVYAFTNATSRETVAENMQNAWKDENVYHSIPDGFFEDGNLKPVSGSYVRQTVNSLRTNIFRWNNPASVTMQAERVAYIEIRICRNSDENQQNATGNYYAQTTWNITSGHAASRTGYDGYLSFLLSGTVTITASNNNNQTLTQKDLLNTEHSIGDYFLSLAKIYGWVLTCDEPSKTVTVWDRNSFFSTGEDTIDLTERVDMSKDITITPLLAASRIYAFGTEAKGGRANAYALRYSRVYGAYRANTGYEFNDEEIDLTDGVVFKTAVPYTARGKDYTIPKQGTAAHYCMELDGYTETLRGQTDATEAYSKDFNPLIPSTWASYSPALIFSDYVARPQFEDDEGKAVAGEDCLLYMAPREEWGTEDGTPLYQITDDIDEMYFQNGDKPCWVVAFEQIADVTLCEPVYIPNFRPWTVDDDGGTHWLTFGIPSEFYDPFLTEWSEDDTIYARYWRAYMRDRYDADTKVLKCWVNLEGIQVGTGLLRRFFWYANSLWVLNKISNYSLTTYDTAECEFVQVRNMANYTDGQIL